MLKFIQRTTVISGLFAVLFLLASAAKADTYLFTVSDPNLPLTATFDVTGSLPSSGYVTSFLTGPATLASFSWNSEAAGFCQFANGDVIKGKDACTGLYSNGAASPQSYAAGDFLSVGSFTSLSGLETVTITDTSLTATPEPASFFYMLGASLVFLVLLGKRLTL